MINQVVPNNAPKSVFREFPQPQNGWYLSTLKQEEEKKSNHLGSTIAVSALVIGFGALALMKGALPKKAAEYMKKWKLKLEEKAKSGSTLANFYKSTANQLTSFMEKLQSVNNITSLKDILFQKFMFGTKFTKKIHKGITRFFNKISRKTVNSSYAKVSRKAAGLNEHILNLNNRILIDHPNDPAIKEAVELINSRMNKVNENFSRGFGIQARTNRLTRLEEATEGLYDYMWNASYHDIKNFRSKNMYQTFIAEERMLPFKTEIAKETAELKKTVFDDLSKNLEAYKKILPEGEYRALVAKVKAVEKSLDNAIKDETVNYVDKARDLKLGSAPTDVLSILFTMGTVGWFLGKSKDKDERISSSLKYGIPAIGAVATTLICTAKLIAGGKSMAIGLLSGWLMSKAGTFVDDVRKQYELDISLEKRHLIKPQSDKV